MCFMACWYLSKGMEVGEGGGGGGGGVGGGVRSWKISIVNLPNGFDILEYLTNTRNRY